MTTTASDGKGGRDLQDALSYVVGHRIRVEILTALHELESASAKELARIVHQPLSTVTHHVGELLGCGAIQVERTEKVRSVDQRFYSLLSPIYVDDEEWAEMTDEERQETCGSVLQSTMAEALAAFGAGKITADPHQVTCWAWFNVDEQGRADLAEEQLRSWRRLDEIEREAGARCAESGEGLKTIFVSSLGFERVRAAASPPPRPEEYHSRQLKREQRG
ncbi:MAG TPA: helix-turn-helix domain-containing protein [Solirubrobacterales bacterium]